MEFGFTSWFSRKTSLTRAFRHLSSAGCKSVEVAAMPAYLSRQGWVAESLSSAGLHASAIGLGIPFIRDPRLNLHSRNQPARRESVRFVNRATDLASKLGAGVVYVCSVSSDRRASTRDVLSFLKESLRECADYAEKMGVVIALEPYPGGEVARFDAACRLVRQVGSGNLGVLLDTGHLAISREAIDEAVVASKGVLKHVHINNNDGVADLHWPPYRGMLGRDDFSSFFEKLSESGYGGRTSVELSNPRPIGRTIAESVDYLNEIVA